MARYLAIDYGGKRIGLAVSDGETRLAAPVATVVATGDPSNDVRTVCGVAEEYGVDEFVVGLPLNMDGTEGPQAKLVRRFGAELERVTRQPVHYWDERLSSVSAQEKLAPAGLTRKKRKARLDRVAAQGILQEFLDSQSGGEPSGRRPDESDHEDSD
jgi:putative Holliday junction resolvase